MERVGKHAALCASVEAERCIVELQRGRAIALDNVRESLTDKCVFQLVETIEPALLEAMVKAHDCQLVVSGARAIAMGMQPGNDAVSLQLEADTSARFIQFLSGLKPEVDIVRRALMPTHPSATELPHPAGKALPPDVKRMANAPLPEQIHSDTSDQFAQAALNLAQQAHVLPALVMYRVQSIDDIMLSADVQQAMQYREQGGDLMMLSHASIPSQYAENIKLTVFREQHGHAEHVAITVGQPDLSGPVSVRLHSSCFTGDILGSLKCDCGEQLHRAIEDMAANDGGIVLYISQEGRGIGLASKLLAYQLQDMGLDTIEANQQLGFTADERRYSAAVYMLEKLGIRSISLMTNNPLKIEALQAQGIDVVSRTPSPATVNVHNARYLETKRVRSGHLASCGL